MVHPPEESLVPLLATGVALAATIHLLRPPLQKWISQLSLRRKLSQEQQDGPDHGSVSGLFIHPVKSLRAVSIATAEIDSKGLAGDRRFMLVYPAPLPVWKDQFDATDTTHRFLTQRQCPSLARVIATFEKDQLILEYNKKKIQLPLHPPSPKQSIRAGIWDDQVLVEDMGEEAAAFLQAIVSADEEAAAAGSMYTKGIRLVVHLGTDRRADPKFTPAAATTGVGATTPPPVSLSDGYPILIACEASLKELNRRLAENGEAPIAMSRFRPNIVIKGTTPFEEDKWKYIGIGDQLFAIVKACPRCKQSCTDQDTGKVEAEPVATMKGFRALGDQPEDVFFAQNAMPLSRSGTIQVGDTIRVLERGDPVYYPNH